MTCLWVRGVFMVAWFFGFSSAVGPAAAAEPLTVDEALERMSRKIATIKDLRATSKVTKFDTVFETKRTLRMEFFYRKPDMIRVDTYKKRRKREVHSYQVILGKDFVTRVWPETKTGERRRVDPEEMKRRRENRNDPLTFLSRDPEDLKRDFNVTLLGKPKAGKVRLLIKPKTDDVPFDYDAVEVVVNTRTWMPTSIKSTKKDYWSLYEFVKIKVNPGLKDADFRPMKGIKIENAGGPEQPKASRDRPNR